MSRFFVRSLFLLFFCFFIQHITYATHVIGGELQLKWLGSGTMYEVQLNMYVNQISVENGYMLVDDFQTVSLTDSLSDNFQDIKRISLPLTYNNPIRTNENACATNAVIRTNLLIYAMTVDMGAALAGYGNSDYYVTFEYCCRNDLINNLEKPFNQNFALYLKCPPLSYRNSSPSLNVLENQYFCTNTLNAFDMSATDADGDRIQYSLVAPLKNIVPRIYSDDPTFNITRAVTWINPSYSGSNPIPGSQPMAIHPTTGLLTFNPSSVGTYCFGILIQEYRGNFKIGELRKDYQFSVQSCPINYKPVISFKDNSIEESDTLTVQLKGSTCFPVYITDLDAGKFFISETILLKTTSYLPENSTVSYPAAGFTIPANVSLSGLRDTFRFDACFDPCAGGLKLNETTYYPFRVIISDNKCPSKYDTLIFTIKVLVEPNALPEVFIDPPTNPKSIKVNELLTFTVFGNDPDATNLLSLKMLNPQRGMSFQNVQDSVETISSTFSWQPNCNDLNPGTYNVSFIIKDNSCVLNTADTVRQTIVIYQDEVSFETMQVTNLITPNGDGMNDYYQIPGIPVGNCDKYFKGIEIYNRWGSRVFYSQDPGFKWYPEVSDGMYYFSIDLNYEVRKGWLQITQ